MMKKTVCVDMDGVLAQYDRWRGVQDIGYPIEGAREFLEELRKTHHVVIYTCRLNPLLNKEYNRVELYGYVADWLEKFEMPYDEIYIDQGKPAAVAYIDDRAVPCQPQLVGKVDYTAAIAAVRSR